MNEILILIKKTKDILPCILMDQTEVDTGGELTCVFNFLGLTKYNIVVVQLKPVNMQLALEILRTFNGTLSLSHSSLSASLKNILTQVGIGYVGFY